MPDTHAHCQNRLRTSVIGITFWMASRKALGRAFETFV